MRILPLYLLALVLGAVRAPAQTMRSYSYDRSYRGERQLKAELTFAAGRLWLGAGTSDRLYQLTLQYDADRFQPVGSYDSATRVVKLGAEGNGKGGIRVDRRSALPQTATIELSPTAELSLQATLGAAEAEFELGGLKLAALELESGASQTTLRFGKPNPGTCRSASVTSGAGELVVTQAGNSGCPLWSFHGGVGSVRIDLDGAWKADGRITLNMALGAVTLVVPQGLGLRVQLSGFLAGFEGSGFRKDGKSYTSAGYAAASRKVDVVVNSALGGVKVEWK